MYNIFDENYYVNILTKLKNKYPTAYFQEMKNGNIFFLCCAHNHRQIRSKDKVKEFVCPACESLYNKDIAKEINKIKNIIEHEYDDDDNEMMEDVIDTVFYITNNIISMMPKEEYDVYDTPKIKLKNSGGPKPWEENQVQ